MDKATNPLRQILIAALCRNIRLLVICGVEANDDDLPLGFVIRQLGTANWFGLR